MKPIKMFNSLKPIKIINNYVFVVIEDATEKHPDGWIHGVYINFNEAHGKFESLLNKYYTGLPFHILKLPVQGKNVQGTLGQFLRA